MEPASVQKRLDRDELSPVAIYPASVIGTLSLLRALMDFRASSLPYRFAFSDFQALPVLALYPRPPAHRCTCSDHARRCALSGYGVEENTINVNIIAALRTTISSHKSGFVFWISIQHRTNTGRRVNASSNPN